MNYIYSLVKVAVWTVVVLLVSQVHIKGKRICDHVAVVTSSRPVQAPIRFIASHVDFAGGARKAKTGSDATGGVVSSGVKKTADGDNAESVETPYQDVTSEDSASMPEAD